MKKLTITVMSEQGPGDNTHCNYSKKKLFFIQISKIWNNEVKLIYISDDTIVQLEKIQDKVQMKQK